MKDSLWYTKKIFGDDITNIITEEILKWFSLVVSLRYIIIGIKIYTFFKFYLNSWPIKIIVIYVSR